MISITTEWASSDDVGRCMAHDNPKLASRLRHIGPHQVLVIRTVLDTQASPAVEHEVRLCRDAAYEYGIKTVDQILHEFKGREADFTLRPGAE